MDLIRNALETIHQQVNSYLENLDRRDDSWVVLTSLVNHEGTLNNAANDKIVMTVYNITRESVVSSFQPTIPSVRRQGTEDSYAVISPPLYLDVHLMFMANFSAKTYCDGLAALSRTIGYFQQTPTFNHDNAPSLSPAIDKLTLEFENLSPVDVNYVMGMLGTRYLPSAFYRVRMIQFDSRAMDARAYAATGIAAETNQTGLRP